MTNIPLRNVLSVKDYTIGAIGPAGYWPGGGPFHCRVWAGGIIAGPAGG